MMKKFYLLITLFCCGSLAMAQCPDGESEVTIDVQTDAYGYEIYWQLVPSGNDCGVEPVFEGGNPAVGCDGGGDQNQAPGGYSNYSTISEGPWCLEVGTEYDIIYLDDWGDGGASFNVSIDGFPMYTFDTGDGSGNGTVHTFEVALPLEINMSAESISTLGYVVLGDVDVSGMLLNESSSTVTSLDLNYQIDDGPVVTSSISDLNIEPFEHYNFTHPEPWNATDEGSYNLKVWASNINGEEDMDASDDIVEKTVIVGPGIPNIVDDYLDLAGPPAPTVIADESDGAEVPRDLDFHPNLSNKDLWVVLKSTENEGGKTLKISNAGQPDQDELVQQDGNAWHFMSLPTGIAFSDNTNFATSPGVFDANHNGGDPFTGPALWSSDPDIYAQPSGGNGSHLDMLHESPHSMGIAHDSGNAFWVNDGHNDCVTYYDFQEDHGPGNADHADGIVRKYEGMGLVEDPEHHVPSHLVLDKETGWLYIVDSENARVVRMDANSGEEISSFAPYEQVEETTVYGNFTSSDYITSGLTEPAGIDVIEDRLIVSDHATGKIHIYDISGDSAVELGAIETGEPGIMGVKVGPEGKIWYVNASTNQVVRLENDMVNVEENNEFNFAIYPNPATNNVLNLRTNATGEVDLNIIDISGKVQMQKSFNSNQAQIDISSLAAGTYFIQFMSSGVSQTKKLIKNH